MRDIFSPGELKVLKILGKRTMSIERITHKIYNVRVVSLVDRNCTAGIVRRINAKCEYHKLDWFLNSFGSGRAGKTIWRDKR